MYKASELYHPRAKIPLKKNIPLQENWADPRHRQSWQMSWARYCWGSWAGYGSLLTVTISEPWKISLLSWCHPGETRRWRPLLGAPISHKSFKPCALLSPSLLSQLEQQTGFPRTSPLAPHPSLSTLFCSYCSSGRSHLGLDKTWTSFLVQHINFCQLCWRLLCYLWGNISTRPWLTPV